MSNFRPISLLSILGKILEDIISDSIDNHIEAQDLLSYGAVSMPKIKVELDDAMVTLFIRYDDLPAQ